MAATQTSSYSEQVQSQPAMATAHARMDSTPYSNIKKATLFLATTTMAHPRK